LSEFRAAENAWSAGSASDPEYVRRYLRTTNEYHLEEAFDGELLSVEAISSAGNFTVLGLLSRILYSKDAVVEMGSCFPYPHPFSSEIIAKVKKAHEVLGLTDGPTHTEVIVDAKGHVEIIDLNPRFVGADVLQSINNAYGIAIEELILNFALGMPISFQPKDRKFSCLQYFMPPEVSVLRNIRFPETPEVRFKTSFIASGTSIKNTNRQLDYLGCYLTVMPSFDAAVDRSRELRTQVLINDTHQGGF
jgi:biotin carboxylase